MRKHLFLFIALCVSELALGASTLIDGLYYNLDSYYSVYTAEVTYKSTYTNQNYTGLKDLVIPETVTYSGRQYKVTSIGQYAFMSTGITSVTIPSSVTSIGSMAFHGCTKLKTVTFSEGLMTIGRSAFGYCPSLESVDIPSSVTSIGEKAFNQGYALSAIRVHADNPNYSSLDDVLYDKAQTTLIAWPAGKGGACVIPEGVTSIQKEALYVCNHITSVSIPSTLTNLDGYTFVVCDSIASIEVHPDNPLYSAKDGVLYNKDQTTLICYPDGRPSASFVIPESVNTIDEYGIYYCTKLFIIYNYATTPQTIIGKNFLYGMDLSERTLYVPEEALETYRTTDTWKEFSSIQAIPDELVIPTIYPHVKIGDLFYNLDADHHTADVRYQTHVGEGNYEQLQSLTIPESVQYEGEEYAVTSIGQRAFYHAFGITSISIPASIKSIGDRAFNECWEVKEIYNYATVPQKINSEVFSGFDKSIPLYVPAGSIEAYHNAKGWNEFTNIQAISGGTTDPEQPTSYTVTFIDWEGTVLLKETVEEGKDAHGPEDTPSREGYNFIGWSKPITNVTSDLTVIAQYELIPEGKLDDGFYLIGQNGWDISALDENLVLVKNEEAENEYSLRITLVENQQFMIVKVINNALTENWYGVGEKNNPFVVTKDYAGETTVYFTPKYMVEWGGYIWVSEVQTPEQPTSYTVTYLDWNATELFKETVEEGKDAHGPEDTPSREGYNFVGWSKPITNITADLVVIALYEKIPEVIATGTCSEQVSWVLSLEGTLVIDGSGTMPNAPNWLEYKDFIKSVIIPEGITNVPILAFAECKNLISVTLPQSLLAIGDSAFGGCVKLPAITLPETIVKIGTLAFAGCVSLTTITIPASVKEIDILAFLQCSGLTSLISKALTPPTLGLGVFAGVDTSIPLYVPAGSMDAYQAIEQWKQFTNMQALPDETPEKPQAHPTDCNVNYLSKNDGIIDSETVTFNLPEAPEIAGFSFLHWEVIGGKLNEGINIQAVYEYTGGDPTAAPEIVINPKNKAQKLLRNGNVYILTDDKTYTFTGQAVK